MAGATSGGEVDMGLSMPNGLQGDVARGGALYGQTCITCHGPKGDGEGPRAYFIVPAPRNFLDARARHTLNRPALFRAIQDGVPGREMPAWGKVLSEQQIADVGEYVFRSFIRPTPP